MCTTSAHSVDLFQRGCCVLNVRASAMLLLLFVRVFGGCIIMSSALNLLIPMCIDDVGYAMTCVVRIIQGLAEVRRSGSTRVSYHCRRYCKNHKDFPTSAENLHFVLFLPLTVPVKLMTTSY